ncbi:hypothetical protein HFO06_34965 [Rhizobium leguminosarum]|uniref:hypothetical protein n=1 Tax=Rhizobium leguminosarum TaxID=384 RepID=UPI001C960FED|nr:hypothetical protein [Rhizobium leguminosarum]MBY5768209.1 hypothetical protein [Rhizobium leguminosarum]
MFLDIVHDLVLEYRAQAGTKNPLVSGGLVSAAMNGIQFTRLPPTAARWSWTSSKLQISCSWLRLTRGRDSVNAPKPDAEDGFPGAMFCV